MSAKAPLRLTNYGVLGIRGADATTFLHAQLSSNVAALGIGECQFTSLNTARGRVFSVGWLIGTNSGFFWILPAGEVQPVLDHLARYVLRADVALENLNESHTVIGSPTSAMVGDDAYVVVRNGRRLTVGVDEKPIAVMNTEEHQAEIWDLAEIRDGLPSIVAANREQFVAQALNLDLTGAIDFSKGCYPGQEIIARLRYRGSVKQRMFRFATTRSANAGDLVTNNGDPVGRVVRCAPAADRFELLAVVRLPALDSALTVGGQALQRLGLPYEEPANS
ncbi:MAG: hypothetical protein V3U59_01805 [Gammaproteobacteria bacterium]